MKPTRLAPLALALALLAGCQTAGTYDPVKTSAVKSALQAPLQEVVTRVILNSPQQSDELAAYFRAVGTVFCRMRDSGTFDSTFLIAEIDKVTGGLQAGLDPLAITAKNTAIALYVIFYSQRTRAELPPDAFAWNLSDLFCKSINTGLRDAGKAGTP